MFTTIYSYIATNFRHIYFHYQANIIFCYACNCTSLIIIKENNNNIQLNTVGRLFQGLQILWMDLKR